MSFSRYSLILFLILLVFACKSTVIENPIEELPFECSGLPNPNEICNIPNIPDGEEVIADLELTKCGTLNQDGATYLLTKDVESTGSCFIISANNITLDLGGHKIIYAKSLVTEPNTVAGVFVYGRENIELRNGTIEEGNTENDRAHPVHFYGVTNAVIRNIHAIAKGTDSCSLHFMYAHGAKIFHNHLTSRVVNVANRHYPGDSVIRIAGGDGDIEVYENYIDSGPQWGIKVSSEDFSSAKVYKNCLKDMKSLYANGYAIGVYSNGMEVYENYINTESRGIHVGTDSAVVRDNYVEVWESPNDEYSGEYWTHGIKIEGATNSQIYCNSVLAKADSSHGNGQALDMSVSENSNNQISKNRFEAKSYDEENDSYAFQATGVENNNNNLITDNIFKSDTVILNISWDNGSGLMLKRNVFERTGEREDFRTIHVGSGSGRTAVNNYLFDTELVNGADIRDMRKWHGSEFTLYFGWTLNLNVTNAGGTVADADIECRDKNNTLVATGKSDADGNYSVELSGLKASGYSGVTDVSFEDYSSHSIAVSKTGEGSGSTSVMMDQAIDASVVLE